MLAFLYQEAPAWDIDPPRKANSRIKTKMKNWQAETFLSPIQSICIIPGRIFLVSHKYSFRWKYNVFLSFLDHITRSFNFWSENEDQFGECGGAISAFLEIFINSIINTLHLKKLRVSYDISGCYIFTSYQFVILIVRKNT